MASQDAAFVTDNSNKEEVFKFDDTKEATPDSQPNEEKGDQTPNVEDTSTEESSTDEDGQKVPYKRFKAKLDEVKEYASRISFLEEQLEELKQQRENPTQEDLTPDEAWTKLYGDSDVAKEAYKIQVKRDAEIAERAVEQALQRISRMEEEEIERLSENEQIIDQNLESLQEVIGKKLTTKQEEEILSIVDEFSPTGNDGKYITLFPFDKAYDIYMLRNKANSAPKNRARQEIADLTGDKSDGDVESSNSSLRKGWHSWEDAI